jgi:hypothetical protein
MAGISESLIQQLPTYNMCILPNPAAPNISATLLAEFILVHFYKQLTQKFTTKLIIW